MSTMVLLQDEVPRSSTTCLSSSLEYARRSLREYVLEWQPTDACTLDRLSAALQELASSVNSTDVVVLVKPGGLCPFCNRAVDLMRQRRHEGETFSLAVADLLHDEREALKLAFADELLERVLTFPVIFVRGVRVGGGFVELEQMCADGRFGAAERTPWTPPEKLELPLASSRSRLLQPAGGGRVCTFQLRVYGNVLRGIALLQVLLLALCLALSRAGQTDAKDVLLVLLGVDCALFLALGPAPWTGLGCLSTLAVWHRRGSVVPSLPYKLVFAIYAFTIFSALVPGASTPGCGLACDGTLVTALVNSSLLAVFRF